jgi:hydrophobic/amphiphilic exporter-1 (mainly G- bacteria), HAE1 family
MSKLEQRGAVASMVRLTLQRRVTVLMLFMVTILIGVISLLGLRLEFLPSGFVNTEISISIPVPNANPVEVEEQVTKPTEEVLRQISGLEEISTSSSKDRARISIKFARGRETNEAFAEVRDLMEMAKLRWPEEVQEYTAFRFNIDTDVPIYQFGLLLDEWKSDSAFLIEEKVIKEIEAVDGVARVESWGIVEETIRIWVDKEKARSGGVSLFDLAQTLGADNRDVIGGRVTDGGQHFYLRSRGRFRDLDELREYPIRPNLKLSDVAEVTPAMSLRNFVFRMNGKRSIWFLVNKEATANTVDVTRRIRERIDAKIKPDRRVIEEGWSFYQNDLNDFGQVIESSLATLIRAALIGGLLAILPLFCFLRRIRLTVIIGLAIPASMLLGLAMLYFAGGTLNILTMLGFTIAIGMLVDNAIVVVENIVRHRDEGKSAFDAALSGTAEVALAITLATLTTVVAFVPLLFLDAGEELSWFAKAVSLPVCYTVISSLFVALVFVPLGTIVLFPDRENAFVGRLRRLTHIALAPLYGLATLVDRAIHLTTRVQGRLLDWALSNRVAALALVLFVCGGLTALSKEKVQVADFGDESGGRIRVNVTMDANFTLSDANGVFTKLYESIASLDDEIGLEYCFYFFRRDRGSLNVGLKDRSPDQAKAAVAQVKSTLPEIPGVKWRVGVESQNAERTAVPLRIFGPDYQKLASISEDLVERLEAHPLVSEVTGGSGQSEDEIVVEPDREKMQMFDVDPRVLMGTVQYALRGQRLPDFQSGDQKQVLIIEYDDAAATSLTDISGLRIWSRSGATYPLSQLADIRYEKGYGTIRKTNGESSISLSINSVDGTKSELAAAAAEVLGGYRLPEGYRWSESSSEDLAKQMGQVLATLLLAAVLVMLLMGVLFESVMLPPAVFFTIPFAFMGSMWTLAATGTQLDLVGMIGAIVLVGIVVNNGIVFLDCAHGLRREIGDRRRALLEAGRLRLRPIAMTTATTVVGLFPMALTEASGSFVSYKALARGVMGGLVLSTLATLFVVPIVYTLLDDLRRFGQELLTGRRTPAEPRSEAAGSGTAALAVDRED